MKTKLKTLGELYITFLKIGAFMFGGGYSMLPLLSRELVTRKGWITDETLLDYFAIAQQRCLEATYQPSLFAPQPTQWEPVAMFGDD